MAEFGFLLIWFLLGLLAVAVGTCTHYANAFLRPYPDKTVEGYRWRDHMLNNTLNSSYVWWGDYDENGWWEFYSLKNYLSHLVIPAFAAFAFGPMYWSDRMRVLNKVCRGFAEVGMAPMFCT